MTGSLSNTPSYRVVQWATGNIGTRALRGVIEHPYQQLVGVHVHSADKVGRDAGELCAGGTTGVLATSSIDDVLALAPDAVIYSPLACDFDDICRLLAAGINIVSTRGEFHRPENLEPDVRARVEAACAEGKTSIHSTGSSPGFISEALPIVLLSIQRRFDRLVIDEFADLSQRNSPDMLFDVMGYGRTPDKFNPSRIAALGNAFGPSLRVVADAVGLPLDSVEATGEIAVTPVDLEIAAGTLKAGTVAAQRVVINGMRDGKPLMTFRPNWYCTTEFEPAWEVGSTGWRVQIEGDAPLDVSLKFPFPIEEMAENSPSYTANRAVNSVAAVVEAEPGIRTTVQLPQVIAQLG